MTTTWETTMIMEWDIMERDMTLMTPGGDTTGEEITLIECGSLIQ